MLQLLTVLDPITQHPGSQRLREIHLIPPRNDDTKVIRALDAVLGSLAFLVSHDLKLFDLLGDGPQALSDVASKLGIAERPAEALLAVASAQGFVESDEGRYWLSSTGEDYLLPDSPTSYAGMLDLRIESLKYNNFEGLKKAVLTNSPQAYGGGDIFRTHAESTRRAEIFTRGMHSRSMSAGLAWPKLLDLSKNHVMLDIAGGSGAHSIGTALEWPDLQAIVLDIAPICTIAQQYINSHELEGRVRTHSADMWADPFPEADMHFYSNIYHDWADEKCKFLTQKSFDALPSGGRLVVHEMLYDDDKQGPLEAAIYSVTMLLWTEGRQYSGKELSSMFEETAFINVEVTKSFGLWSIVTGRKP